MNINIDEAAALDALIKWDLSLTIGGQEYRVRPMTNADVAKLGSVGQMSEEKGYEFIASLFESPVPDVKMWSDATARAVLGSIVGHLRGIGQKRFQAVVSRAAALTTAK